MNILLIGHGRWPTNLYRHVAEPCVHQAAPALLRLWWTATIVQPAARSFDRRFRPRPRSSARLCPAASPRCSPTRPLLRPTTLDLDFAAASRLARSVLLR